VLTGAIRLLGVVPIGSICIYRLATIALNARSWQLLLPRAERPGFFTLFRLRWIGESVNNLLPVAQVGGDVARASLVAARGVSRADATATMLADLAIGIITQMLFGLAGALALAKLLPAGPGRHAVWAQVVSGLIIAALTVVVLAILFHWGAARVARRVLERSKARDTWSKLAGGFARLEIAVQALLARERAIASSVGWHLFAWLSQVGETWMLLSLFGAPVSLRAAFAIESLTTGARGAAFFVPSGVGVQEMTLISLCRLAGVDMKLAIALGIAKRAREIAMGVPGLLAWMSDRKWWRRWRRTDD
jgi:putative membrane protein